jgi:hypothetical protein
MRRSRRPAENQPLLPIPMERDDHWWRCQGVFAANYVEKQLDLLADVPSANEIRDIYDKIKAVNAPCTLMNSAAK